MTCHNGLKILSVNLRFQLHILVQFCPSPIKHNMPKMHENKLTLILISLTSLLLWLSGFYFCIVIFFPSTLLKKFKLCQFFVGNGVCDVFIIYISIFFNAVESSLLILTCCSWFDEYHEHSHKITTHIPILRS